ncbi:NADH-quinone oxidoreductase subunit NuoH [Chloracidobacterium validum]|uniref:NADH-quinone oxidoreductase subunit H n=2 Tax=Chloracidobacterium validum TaxID=2821543 RepID=A0ABX8BDQ0_9BACT|nr:NADH-quinone oxidoreductase subunit NuoH [Chloracidobacterium validum]
MPALNASPQWLESLVQQVYAYLPTWLTANLTPTDAADFIVWPLIQIGVMLVAVLTAVAYLTLAERKVSAWIQVRVGPNRTGPLGLLQPAADGIKLLIKEDVIPFKADKTVFTLAPIISMVCAFIVLAVLPYGPHFASITNINIGLLFILSVSSVGVLGIILGGWASNSKYPLLGALRSSAQMVSYEAAIGLTIVSALIFTRTFSMQGIVEAQRSLGVWFVLFLFPSFIVFLVSVIAETNRAPFDLAEAESELVGGFHTEYSGFRFSIFFIAEYANMVVVAAIGATLYLGGWYVPGMDWVAAQFPEAYREAVLTLLGVTAFAIKSGAILYLFIWMRWTFPRYRYDQLMELGWKWLMPAALANIVLTATVFIIGKELGLVRSVGGVLEMEWQGKLFFTVASLLSMFPILALLNAINRNSKSFNLRAQRTTIPISTRKVKLSPGVKTA